MGSLNVISGVLKDFCSGTFQDIILEKAIITAAMHNAIAGSELELPDQKGKTSITRAKNWMTLFCNNENIVIFFIDLKAEEVKSKMANGKVSIEASLSSAG